MAARGSLYSLIGFEPVELRRQQHALRRGAGGSGGSGSAPSRAAGSGRRAVVLAPQAAGTASPPKGGGKAPSVTQPAAAATPNNTTTSASTSAAVAAAERESLQLLEWPGLCRQVACFTKTPMGAEVALRCALPVGRSLHESQRLLQETAEAQRAQLGWVAAAVLPAV